MGETVGVFNNCSWSKSTILRLALMSPGGQKAVEHKKLFMFLRTADWWNNIAGYFIKVTAKFIFMNKCSKKQAFFACLSKIAEKLINFL